MGYESVLGSAADDIISRTDIHVTPVHKEIWKINDNSPSMKVQLKQTKLIDALWFSEQK